MARRSAEGTARVAVMGAASESGSRLRAELAGRGVPGARVSLFGALRGEAVISEYDGEARLLQEPDLDEIGEHDVVFVCEAGEDGARLAARPGAADRILDLTGELGASLAHEPLKPAPERGPIGVAHPLAIVLAEMLGPLRALGLARATATILRPAADFGESGLEELREQTIHLLRFEGPPTAVFGRQLAFNVIPQALLPGGAGLDARVAAEARTLLGPGAPEISATLVAVPVFHGHGIAARLEGVRGGAAATREALAAAGIVTARGRAAGTPMDAPESRRTDAAVVEDDGADAVRVWAVAAEAGAAAARQALLLAARRAAL